MTPAASVDLGQLAEVLFLRLSTAVTLRKGVTTEPEPTVWERDSYTKDSAQEFFPVPSHPGGWQCTPVWPEVYSPPPSVTQVLGFRVHTFILSFHQIYTSA